MNTYTIGQEIYVIDCYSYNPITKQVIDEIIQRNTGFYYVINFGISNKKEFSEYYLALTKEEAIAKLKGIVEYSIKLLND